MLRFGNTAFFNATQPKPCDALHLTQFQSFCVFILINKTLISPYFFHGTRFATHYNMVVARTNLEQSPVFGNVYLAMACCWQGLFYEGTGQ